MNVIKQIDGREAIPVRAIPLLTNWKVMWPDAVAKALAGNEHYDDYFAGLCAYRIEGGATKPIRATWWQGFAVRNLKALSDRIEADQITKEVGYQKWLKESLAELPAGVFVWKDEYVPMYESRYGSDAMARIVGRELTPSEIQARELDFDPFISAEYAALVNENFAYQQHAPEQHADTQAAPVVVKPESMQPAPDTQAGQVAPVSATEVDLTEAVAVSEGFVPQTIAARIADWVKLKESAEYKAINLKYDEVERSLCEANENLERRQETLKNAPGTGDVQKVEDAERAVRQAEKAVEDANIAFKTLRGDFDFPDETQQPAPAQADALEQVPTVEPASDGPAKPKRTKRRTWRDVSETYLELTFKELQYPTVKNFFAALMKKAGADNGSPFDKGALQNSGSLFARDVGAVVTFKMIEGFVTELRKKK